MRRGLKTPEVGVIIVTRRAIVSCNKLEEAKLKSPAGAKPRYEPQIMMLSLSFSRKTLFQEPSSPADAEQTVFFLRKK
jgi:hypothetical protein